MIVNPLRNRVLRMRDSCGLEQSDGKLNVCSDIEMEVTWLHPYSTCRCPSMGTSLAPTTKWATLAGTASTCTRGFPLLKGSSSGQPGQPGRCMTKAVRPEQSSLADA